MEGISFLLCLGFFQTSFIRPFLGTLWTRGFLNKVFPHCFVFFFSLWKFFCYIPCPSLGFSSLYLASMPWVLAPASTAILQLLLHKIWAPLSFQKLTTPVEQFTSPSPSQNHYLIYLRPLRRPCFLLRKNIYVPDLLTDGDIEANPGPPVYFPKASKPRTTDRFVSRPCA